MTICPHPFLLFDNYFLGLTILFKDVYTFLQLGFLITIIISLVYYFPVSCIYSNPESWANNFDFDAMLMGSGIRGEKKFVLKIEYLKNGGCCCGSNHCL